MKIQEQHNTNIGDVENADTINKHISITQQQNNAAEFAEAVNNIVGIIKSAEDYVVKISQWVNEKRNKSEAIRYHKKAADHDKQGNFEAAINCLLKSLKLDYESAHTHHYLAMLLWLKTDKTNEAFAHAKIALDLEPEEPACYDLLGELYLEKDDLDNAAKSSLTAYKLRKSQFADTTKIKYNACHRLGRICLKKGLWSDAVDNFKHCLEINAPNPFMDIGSVYHGMAIALHQLGMNEDALTFIKKANKARPCKLFLDMTSELESYLKGE